jgi:hypothetical protein
MSESIQLVLANAILTLLKPLVRILLRNGVAYGSFAELAKKTYVDVAFEELAPPGKKQTISRVSALTGFSRKEAKRLHELEHSDPHSSEQRYNRSVRVISGWTNDSMFLDKQGQPLELPLDGEQTSFFSLIRKYSGDVTPKSMLAVLVAAGSVEHDGDRVRLIRRAYVPGSDPGEKLRILGTDAAELISTIDHNLVSRPDELRYQRKVSIPCVKADAVPAFQALSAQKAQALLEELDALLGQYETTHEDAEDCRYVSVGIYFYESESMREKDS